MSHSWARELTCGDAWLTSEGNLDGLLEHLVVEFAWCNRGKTQEEVHSPFVRGGAREALVSHLVWILHVFAYIVNFGLHTFPTSFFIFPTFYFSIPCCFPNLCFSAFFHQALFLLKSTLFVYNDTTSHGGRPDTAAVSPDQV